MQWNTWYPKKLNNWHLPLCLLASIHFYHYDHLFLNLWYLYILVYIFFISSSIKTLFPLFNQLNMIKNFHDDNNIFNEIFIYFIFFPYRSLVCTSNLYFSDYVNFWWCLLRGKLLFFTAKSLSSWSITLIINFTSFVRILFCFD